MLHIEDTLSVEQILIFRSLAISKADDAVATPRSKASRNSSSSISPPSPFTTESLSSPSLYRQFILTKAVAGVAKRMRRTYDGSPHSRHNSLRSSPLNESFAPFSPFSSPSTPGISEDKAHFDALADEISSQMMSMRSNVSSGSPSNSLSFSFKTTLKSITVQFAMPTNAEWVDGKSTDTRAQCAAADADVIVDGVPHDVILNFALDVCALSVER